MTRTRRASRALYRRFYDKLHLRTIGETGDLAMNITKETDVIVKVGNICRSLGALLEHNRDVKGYALCESRPTLCCNGRLPSWWSFKTGE